MVSKVTVDRKDGIPVTSSYDEDSFIIFSSCVAKVK